MDHPLSDAPRWGYLTPAQTDTVRLCLVSMYAALSVRRTLCSVDAAWRLPEIESDLAQVTAALRAIPGALETAIRAADSAHDALSRREVGS